MANATKDPPEVSLLATGDAAPAPGTPIVLNAAYFELTGVNLSCFVKHLEVSPENKPVTATTFCAEVDYPSVVKWHLRVTYYQTFAAGSVKASWCYQERNWRNVTGAGGIQLLLVELILTIQM